MSPRFRRYLLGSLRVLALMLLLVLGLNWLAGVANLPWPHISLTPPVLAWLTVFLLRWATRAEPERRD